MIRFKLLFIILCGFIACNITAQRNCGTDQYLEERINTDPDFAKKFAEWIKMGEKTVDEQSRSVIGCTGANSVIVPVAIHYGSPITCANYSCLLQMAQAQIQVLNEDFGATNADLSYYTTTLNGLCPSDYPLSYAPTGGGSCIQFCLATHNHPMVSGLADGEPAITVGEYTWSGGAVTNGDWPGYLNIVVSDGGTAGLGGGTLGISALPGSANGDGFFVGHEFFGAPGISCTSGAAMNTGAPYNLGRTATHEAGHYFGLLHTFQSGCGGDVNAPGPINVNDTPGQNGSTGGCPNVTGCNGPTSCGGEADPFYSFMDYSNDACLVMFTEDQSSVINYWGNQLNWANNTTVCQTIQTGVPTPTFTPNAGPIQVCADNNTINFTDTSSGSCGQSVTGWAWTFSGAGVSPTSSSSQNPNVTVSTSGTLTVGLTLMSGATSSTTTTENIAVTVLPASDPMCTASPCTTVSQGPYSNLNSASGCFEGSGCEVIEPNFEVFAGEGYTLPGLDAGVSYTFEFCNGYNASTWGEQAVITVAEYNLTTSTVGSVLSTALGCTITFTPAISGDFVVILSGESGCISNTTDNGLLTFSCSGSSCYACGNDFSDDNGTTLEYSNSSNETYTICPDNPNEILTITFTAFDVEPDGADCYDEFSVYNGTTATPANLIGTYCGTSPSDLPNNGVFEGADFGDCFTFNFQSDNSVTEDGWNAAISCCTNSLTGSSWDANNCPIATNGGLMFSEMVNNDCTSNPSLSDFSDFSGLTGEEDSSIISRSANCPGNAPGTTNTVIYAIECDSDGVQPEALDVTVTDNNGTALGNIDVALYGPVTGGCPNYTGATFVDCDQDMGSATASASVMDGQTYLVVVSTDNPGQFMIASNSPALPVELVNLSAIPSRIAIDVTWSTASETNNAGFLIQRSIDGKKFSDLSFVDGKGSSSRVEHYTFKDESVEKGVTYYYRLSQLDYDGASVKSSVVSATLSADTKDRNVMVYPNPSLGSFYIDMGDVEAEVVASIIDQNGKIVFTQNVSTSEPTFIKAGELPNGVYHLVLTGTEYLHTQKIVVLK